MTKKQLTPTPETSITKTYKGIIRVLECIDKFKDYLGEEKTFERHDFVAFRNNGKSVEKVKNYYGYYDLIHYEDIDFSTLRSYGVLKVVDTKKETRCIKPKYGIADEMYRVNGEQFISESEYKTLKKIMPNCEDILTIESGFYGEAIEVTVYTYTFNYDRIKELNEMADCFSRWAIEG